MDISFDFVNQKKTEIFLGTSMFVPFKLLCAGDWNTDQKEAVERVMK